MRIDVVGPTHPYKGDGAAHTTRTAQALTGTDGPAAARLPGVAQGAR
jgi:hypothetical protein